MHWIRDELRRHLRPLMLLVYGGCISLCLTISALIGGINWYWGFGAMTLGLSAAAGLLALNKRGSSLWPPHYLAKKRIDTEWKRVNDNCSQFIASGVKEDKLRSVTPSRTRVIAPAVLRMSQSDGISYPAVFIAVAIMTAVLFVLAIVGATNSQTPQDNRPPVSTPGTVQIYPPPGGIPTP